MGPLGAFEPLGPRSSTLNHSGPPVNDFDTLRSPDAKSFDDVTPR